MKAWICVVALVGCGSGDGGALSREEVEGLPPGDAIGEAGNGEFEIQLVTTACRARCPEIDAGGFTISTCDLNEVDDATLTITQRDGELVIDASGLIVDRLEGGIFADGSFVVGAFATQQSGEVTIAIRSEGTLSGDIIEGTAEGHASGKVAGTIINCSTSYELAGMRSEFEPAGE
jgi:hypothetical protein